MRYAIRRYRRKWGVFKITSKKDEDGELISTHKTAKLADRAAIKRLFNNKKKR